MAPARRRQQALANGDTVSIAVRHLGEDYARSVAGAAWASDRHRCEGTVVDKQDNYWVVAFDDMEETISLRRNQLEFVRRPDDDDQRRYVDRDSSDSSEEEAGAPPVQVQRGQRAVRGRIAARAAAAALFDSSDGESIAAQDSADDADDADGDGWNRNDSFSADQRAAYVQTARLGPTCLIPNFHPATTTLFDVALHWLKAPMAFYDEGAEGAMCGVHPSFLAVMAAEMQAAGRQKASGPNDAWNKWTVSFNDMIQWIGVWMYFLAHPQSGAREDYFKRKKYGPCHNLPDILKLGGQGHRGRRWFDCMHACFTLPTGSVPQDDPFRPVRAMWESFRIHAGNTIDPSWLLLLDESMVKWMGRGMPGLMVVPRKPTPIGAELHTLCCATCGVMINYELHEGKELMARKEFCDQYKLKSVALTLRCLKRYFGTVCLLLSACSSLFMRFDVIA